MLGRRIVSAALWAAYGVLVIVWTPLMAVAFVLTVPFDPGRYFVGRMFRIAAVIAAKMNPLWRFRTSGVRIDDPRRPWVVVSNHESYADIFLISHLPWEMKWLSKDTIFKIPVMGWMMSMAGDVRITRVHLEEDAARLLDCGGHVWLRLQVRLPDIEGRGALRHARRCRRG